MTTLASPAAPDDPAAPTGKALAALEATISCLKADARSGRSAMPLRGRNIGMLCDDPQRPECFMLERAACELGARVALVRAGLHDAQAHQVGGQTAKVLGRLYDALICVDVAPHLVHILCDDAGIPASGSVARQWVALQSERPDVQDDERYLLKALMVEACA